uniref:Sarcolemmal membrane-associated protein n=1 Tax=Aceria tosichella TaxID=561515 RepID=A0A6G1S9B8_9ACAR
MRPRAILRHHSNSFPFEERNLDLTGVVKVGRAVAKCKPQGDNAIFDCKVLSRNHAILWFENGKFFLKDTCSSNGTFVNNNRLSPANEDSPGKEIHSNDIIQFGVEVVDSTNKITHGCIILRIKLFYPNGSEASRTTTMFNIPTANMLPPYYSYTQMIEREKRIYQKLSEIEDVLADAHPILDLLVDAKKTEELLIKQIDAKTNQAIRLEAELNRQEANHVDMRRQLSAKCKEKDIEIANLYQQIGRIIKQNHRQMTTSLILFVIALIIGGFDMIVMLTKLL